MVLNIWDGQFGAIRSSGNVVSGYEYCYQCMPGDYGLSRAVLEEHELLVTKFLL